MWQHISFLFIVICSWCRSEFIMQAASWGSSARTSKRRWGTATIMWWFGCFCFGSQFCCSESLSLLNMQAVSWGTKCSSPRVTKRIMSRYVCPALNFVNLLLFLLLQTSYVNSSLFFPSQETPFQMLGTRCCPCCIWWPWSACRRPTPCFSPGHTAMAMPQEFLKVLQLLKVNPKCCRLDDCCSKFPAFKLGHWNMLMICRALKYFCLYSIVLICW